MSGVALTGLSSGLDTDSIITQLMSLEQGPLNRLKLAQQQDQTLQTSLTDLKTKVSSLRDAASALGSVINWLPTQSLTGSADTVATGRTTGAVGAGSYQVNVLQLAQTAQQSYDATSLPGTLTISLTGDPTKTITVSASSAADYAAAINADGTSPVSASVVTTNGATRLVFTSKTGGQPGEFSVVDGSNAALGGLITSRAGQDAQVQITGDPTVYTTSTNVLKDAIVGVELTLKSTGTTNITASTPATDKDAIVAAVKSFVDTYNSTMTALRAATTETRDPKATDTASQLKGLLHSDSQLNGLIDQLRGLVEGSVPGGGTTYSTLAQIGISTGAPTGSGTLNQNALQGLLTVDETALRSALDTNPDAVRGMLGATAGVTGFQQKMSEILSPQTQAGGLFDARLSAITSDLSDNSQRQVDVQAQLDLKKQMLQAQFAAMETALAQAQSQSSWLSGQIASLSA